MKNRTLLPTFCLLLLLGAAACGGGGDPAADSGPDGVGDTTPDSGPDTTPDSGPDTTPDSGSDGDGGTDPISCAPAPFQWETGPGPTLTPHSSWAETIDFGWSAFALESGSDVVWVKFTILLEGEPRVIFQDGHAYLFHSDFARERLDPFKGMSRAEFDAISLHRDGQRALLGTLLMPMWSDTPEVGVQLIGLDPYPAELVAAALALVTDAVTSTKPLEAIYMPTAEQARVTSACPDRFAALSVSVGSTERWTGGLGCYSQGWAIGRLVDIPGFEVADAFEAGTITTDDILLTRDVPAELPPVAGILTTTASAASSHVAILASTYGAPYALLARDDDVAAAKALVGRTVAVSAWSPYSGAACQLRLFPVDHLSLAQLSELAALRADPPLDLASKQHHGALVVEVDGLVPADIRYVGGKAANYGVLRSAIPQAVRPAKALSFELWDAYMARPYQGGTLGTFIAGRLAAHPWPASVGALSDELRAIRAIITDEVDFAPAYKLAVQEALGGFDPALRLRFRSSTNVEDSEVFTGAGLYDSKSGCLADDLDDDKAGPSLCDASKKDERGIWRAIRSVYASFYNLNATIERMRHGVDEAEVGMGVLVHPSFPDADELANGVGLIDWRADSSRSYILSSQVGAVSVANPDPGVLPEITVATLYSSFDSVYTLAPSSLLPLGARVLADDAEYVALARLLDAVRAAMVALYPGEPLRLDFEYKKERTDGLTVKQVRRVPPQVGEPTLTAFLVDDGPVRRCTFQGEYGDVFANHRLKSRWTLGIEDRWMSEAGLATSFYDAVDVELVADGARITLSGAAASWPQATHSTMTGFEGQSVVVRDGARPAGLGGGLALATTLAHRLTPQQGPMLPLSSLDWMMEAKWDEARLGLHYGEDGQTIEKLTVEENVRLATCPEDDPAAADDLPQTRVFVGTDELTGLKVTTRFYWPPSPTGVVAGYTSPLKRWVDTTIEGLTSEPLVLTDWFAQTYRPEHHNFGEHLLFEPRLDPAVSASARAELEALGVVMIYAYGSPWSGESQTLFLFDAEGQPVTLD